MVYLWVCSCLLQDLFGPNPKFLNRKRFRSFSAELPGKQLVTRVDGFGDWDFRPYKSNHGNPPHHQAVKRFSSPERASKTTCPPWKRLVVFQASLGVVELSDIPCHVQSPHTTIQHPPHTQPGTSPNIRGVSNHCGIRSGAI